MAKATRTGQVVDGQVYEKNEEIWDLGLWRHNPSPESKYDYTGNENANKLPPYACAGTSAYNPVTGVAYVAYADPQNPGKVLWHEA